MLWAVWRVLLAIYLIGRPTVADYMRLAYNGTAYMAFLFVLGPAVYLTLGIEGCALIFLLRVLPPRRPALPPHPRPQGTATHGQPHLHPKGWTAAARRPAAQTKIGTGILKSSRFLVIFVKIHALYLLVSS